MRKTGQISLKECYAILQLSKDATLEDVKKSYRKRAFELHPDLNPDDPTASKQFQVLNEAYVALSQIMQKEEEARQAKERAKEKAKAQSGASGSYAHQSQSATQKGNQKSQESFRKERAYTTKEGAQREEEARKRQEARKAEEARKAQENRKAEEARRAEEARKAEQAQKAQQERQRREAREKEEAKKEDARIKEDINKRAEESRQRAASAAYAKEDVLRDLLHDPFARRVFEDIYSEVSKQSSEKSENATASQESSADARRSEKKTAQEKSGSAGTHWTEHIRPKAKTEESKKAHTSSPLPPPTAEVDLGENRANLHLENSFSGKIFGWFRQQIDDEQTIRMPASHLFKGARIRLQIRRGLSEDLSTVEIVLPQDFVVGKPIRLRGLGRKVGKWQGDLYLTIESK